ncbi:MAG TPA: LuxR C-terminal-related transcriptional regulator [Candidatus Limnocylindrales bacterium]|nr:LuxR C-terminal-related transcriptional regulator [Candidatus Limnocylindrales bacterium]
MATDVRVDPEAGPVPATDAIVLETKLTRPRVRPQHVARSALIAELRAAGTTRLTLVAAPPGYGKTTLLAELAADGEPAVAWLSLDEDDNDPARFFGYLVAALRRSEPDIGDRALAALRAPGAELVGLVVPMLLNDLAALDRELVLVLDDYYLVTNPDVHRALVHVIERMPASLRIVVATREDPPFPLARWRARGELVEIRAGDLRFTADEASAFLVDALGLDISAADVERLRDRTEGWPAALYLAALSLRGRPDAGAIVERFAGDDRYVVDYLTTEVLARQPPDLRSFLVRTSILKRFSGALCDAVTGRTDSAALLAELEHTNLLVVPLDTTREWYRYHHLFRELLQYELAATDRDAVPELHRRASAWDREAGLIVDALGHAIAAGDVEAAAELLATHYGDFVEQGQLATVIRWVEALPEAAAGEDWQLCFAAGVAFAHAGRFDEAEQWLDRARRAPPLVRGGQEPAGPLDALSSYLRLLRGDIGGTVAYGRLALAAPAATEPMWALAPQMVLAPGLWWAGEAGEARVVLETATRTAQAAGIHATVVYALGIRAAIALDEQDDATAGALAGQAIELMHRTGLDDHPWAAMAHVVHGTLLARRGDVAAAAEEVEHGLALGEWLRAWQLIAFASLALAEIRNLQHDAATTRRLLARVREILTSVPDPGDGFDRLERTEKALRVRASRDRSARGGPFWELSQRELEVLRLLPSGLSQREVAAELYVSFNTIRTHTKAIFNKLGVASRGEAVERAQQLGLL